MPQALGFTLNNVLIKAPNLDFGAIELRLKRSWRRFVADESALEFSIEFALGFALDLKKPS